MTQLLYPNSNDISHTTKEAVASAILHTVYDRLRGAGPTGRIIYRDKPSKVIHTQHLLPRRRPSETAATYEEKDDVTSPAHIGTAGLTFQIADRKDKAITVALRACIYLRMLPTSQDLTSSNVVFRLAKNARSIILRHRREALRRAEEDNKAILGADGRNSPVWLDIKNRVTKDAENAALLELGIAPAVLDSPGREDVLVSILSEEDEAPGTDDPAVNDDPESGGANSSDEHSDTAPDAAIDAINAEARGPATADSDTLKAFEFKVGPGATDAPPDVLIEREHIPQKWLRLPLELGSFRIDLSLSREAVERSIAEFNAQMQRRVESAIDAWEADDNAETGGLLWGFPAGRAMHSRTIVPAEVVAWDQTLAMLRTNRRIARPHILPVLEYENLEDPLHPDERTVRIILANESDLIDAKQAAARESDATLFQVEISAEFDPDLHRPIRLERIAASYRYNQFLSYDALGINCGVRRRGLVNARILETTSLPVYCQPLVRQFDITPGPDFTALGSDDGGLDVLRSLLKAFDDWLASVVASRPYAQSLDPVADAQDYAREKQQFEEVDLRGWRAEREAIARGLAILEKAFQAQSSGKAYDDPEVMPLTAWRFTNQTFGEFWGRKSKSVTGWRLFQVAFILSQIAAVVSRVDTWKGSPAQTSADDREATLLYFSTGGGKSESFFGLLVFASRLTGCGGRSAG
ncbi:hypothetical protein [Mesorhizobium sp. AR02]|uniref:hypothetical protein n=1 Tax=Mesorhizobium sp. AR02 TaxID=2865837 RepID=UPI00215FDF34|nr:hypothetical protein [Mesorhizobium sp. AR02]